MFMFFFFDELNKNKIMQEAIYRYCFSKLLSDGYCDMNPIFGNPKISKNEMAAKLEIQKSPIEKLYRDVYPQNELDMEEALLAVLKECEEKGAELKKDSYFAIMYYVFRVLGSYEKKTKK